MAEKKDKRLDELNVEFQKDFVASRGAGISGAKGEVKKYPWSEDLQRCIEDDVVKVVKQPAAAKREKAKTD